MRWFTALLPSLALVTLGRAFVNPEPVKGNTAVHDPTICKDKDGTYFVFSSAVGIEIRTSKDRVTWNLIGTVWPDGAPWTDPYTNASNRALWAPDCTYINGEFYLYYAASTSGSQHSAIFLAKSSTGQPGSFDNLGLVISTSKADNYNAIDPNLLIVDGTNWLLSFGSFWTGIKEMAINSSTGKTTSNKILSLAQRTAANAKAIEASCMFKNGAYYYLFTSWDRCCRGVNSTYNIRVGRSTSATGGFVDQDGVLLTSGGGTLVLGSHDNVIGPGGQDLMDDDDGPIIVYHYSTPSGSFLGINRLDFSSGWPIVV